MLEIGMIAVGEYQKMTSLSFLSQMRVCAFRITIIFIIIQRVLYCYCWQCHVRQHSELITPSKRSRP